jgi:BRCT domain type II-containing protein
LAEHWPTISAFKCNQTHNTKQIHRSDKCYYIYNLSDHISLNVHNIH